MIIIFSFNYIYAAPFGDLNSETLAVSLVIDTSGSMYSTDPNRLREDVAHVFIGFLNPEDYLGIITFNSSVDLVVPMGQLQDNEKRTYYKDLLSPKINGNPNSNTDYKAALDEANKQLDNLYKPNVTKIIVFLTDGKPDPDPANITNNPEKMNNYMDELWRTVGVIGSNNYPVYSIGFSDGIDVDVLNKIASATNGDVRIFKDSNELDLNLIQILKSRELIVKELLAPTTTTNVVNISPSLSTDFWLKEEGYRKGEETVISAFLEIGSKRVNSGNDLLVNKFDLHIDYDDGNSVILPLYDDGNSQHGDIRGNDGIWSNKVIFDINGMASTNLQMSGTLKGEEITLNKYIGEYRVATAGTIQVTTREEDLWVKNEGILSIPVGFKNNSDFNETILVRVDDGFGKLQQNQIHLEPKEYKSLNLSVEINPDLQNGVHNISIEMNPINSLTKLDMNSLVYDVEVLSYFESLSRTLSNNFLLILIILGIFVGLPLIVILLGMLFYILIGKSQYMVKGILTYWDEMKPEVKKQLDLNNKKKESVVITFDTEKQADFLIEGSPYKYDLIISKSSLKNNKKFVLGWRALLSKKDLTELVISCTQPGIMEFEGDIVTKKNLYDSEVFTSGTFIFQYANEGSKDSKEGKNILEGRI